jgi:hypothetical protein
MTCVAIYRFLYTCIVCAPTLLTSSSFIDISQHSLICFITTCFMSSRVSGQGHGVLKTRDNVFHLSCRTVYQDQSKNRISTFDPFSNRIREIELLILCPFVCASITRRSALFQCLSVAFTGTPSSSNTLSAFHQEKVGRTITDYHAVNSQIVALVG